MRTRAIKFDCRPARTHWRYAAIAQANQGIVRGTGIGLLIP
jgi:hypothetical protein